MTSTQAGTPSLQAFLDAFNAHDVDAIMSFFTENCVFDTPRGPAPGGRRLVGPEQVRQGIQARFDEPCTQTRYERDHVCKPLECRQVHVAQCGDGISPFDCDAGLAEQRIHESLETWPYRFTT